MTELLRLFMQIALLRKGPQDLPASPMLLTLTIAVFSGVDLVVGTVLPPVADRWLWASTQAVGIVFTIFWYAMLVYVVKKPERYLQTCTAVFGFQILLSPLLVVAQWLSRRFEQDSLGGSAVSLISFALLIWILAANSHIVKEALEWAMAPSVALVILEALAGELLVLTFFHT